jgi:tetratricopeptide (TPR) repeat protein
VIVHEEVRKFGMVVDQGCMKCLDCVSVCPKGALYFGFGKPAGALARQAGQRSKPGVTWGEELVLAALFLAAFVIYRGLYGVIPFLLALGLSGVLAFGFAALVRMLRRPSASFLGRALKQEGKLTRAGRVFATSAAAVALLSVHSALIQFHAGRSAGAIEELHAQREAFLDDPARRLSGEPLARAERALASAQLVRRLGLLWQPRDEEQLAWLALFAGAPEGFEQGLRARAAAAAEPAGLRYDLARYLAARGRGEEAVAELEAALSVSPSASAYDRLARLHFQAGRSAEALAAFRRALEDFPDNPDLWFNQGVVLGLVGRVEEAAAAFRRVLELDPGRVDARENLEGLRAASRSR